MKRCFLSRVVEENRVDFLCLQRRQIIPFRPCQKSSKYQPNGVTFAGDSSGPKGTSSEQNPLLVTFVWFLLFLWYCCPDKKIKRYFVDKPKNPESFDLPLEQHHERTKGSTRILSEESKTCFASFSLDVYLFLSFNPSRWFELQSNKGLESY